MPRDDPMPTWQRAARCRLAFGLLAIGLVLIALATLRLASPSTFRTVVLCAIALFDVLWLAAMAIAVVVGPRRESAHPESVRGHVADWCRMVFWFTP